MGPIASPPRVAAAAVLLLAVSVPTAAQSVSSALAFLITTQAVDTGDAARDRAAAQATSDTLARALVSSLATLPLASSSSGFSYRFNPLLGTVERTSDTFGPFYVERALTGGAGRTSVAMTWQYAAFSRIDGMPLEDGTLVTTSNRFTDEAQAFDVETLALRVRANTLTLSGAYGVTDRLDVGAAVPLMTLSLEGTRADTYRGTRYQQATASASATHLGDITLTAKYNLVAGTWGGVSVGADVRLPTGAAEDLLGAGQTGGRVFGVISAGSSVLSGHVNVGIDRGGVSNGFDVSGAAVVAATPRLTLSGELLVRRFDDIGRIAQDLEPHPTIPGVQTLRLVPLGSSTTFTAAAGVKWNIAATWLLRVNVLVPVNDTGLTSRVVPSIALEYRFAR